MNKMCNKVCFFFSWKKKEPNLEQNMHKYSHNKKEKLMAFCIDYNLDNLFCVCKKYFCEYVSK